MTRKTLRLLETLEGTGKVLRNDVPIATVQYFITIHQEMLHVDPDILPGLQIIAGRLVVSDGERDLVNGDEMVLTLQDGRRARFIANEGSSPPGSARIHVNEIA